MTGVGEGQDEEGAVRHALPEGMKLREQGGRQKA